MNSHPATLMISPLTLSSRQNGNRYAGNTVQTAPALILKDGEVSVLDLQWNSDLHLLITSAWHVGRKCGALATRREIKASLQLPRRVPRILNRSLFIHQLRVFFFFTLSSIKLWSNLLPPKNVHATFSYSAEVDLFEKLTECRSALEYLYLVWPFQLDSFSVAINS